jgi:hypothetical protein
MAGMESDTAETIWALEEACEASLCAGDYEKSISFYHDDFLGWPEVASPLMGRDGTWEPHGLAGFARTGSEIEGGDEQAY